MRYHDNRFLVDLVEFLENLRDVFSAFTVEVSDRPAGAMMSGLLTSDRAIATRCFARRRADFGELVRLVRRYRSGG